MTLERGVWVMVLFWLSTALLQVTRKANCWEPSVPLKSSQHSCNPSVRRTILTLGFHRIKISGALDWIQYIPCLSFPEDLVQFLLSSFSLFMILKCKNYLCEWHSCSQQGGWQECTTFRNFWHSGQYSWLSILLLMLQVCCTEVIPAGWYKDRAEVSCWKESCKEATSLADRGGKKSYNFLHHNSYLGFNPRAL